ncbi:hypothetical protein A5741_01460 [Mycolicibacterium conceptionense]|uniref:hypothetical protein n=1 Tax=Mycolicibacterium conceptionense TaxID=451644 RepID=UPI00096FFB40|nr:hypothetical protein [Mycolicibacterium conceptionense]OMB88867.1 hypothetical protein A5741_01460 [Mycolicibacterium conceptionense]
MTTMKVGDKVRRRLDAPSTDTGVWTVTHVFGPVIRIRQGSRVNVVRADRYISERHARVIAAQFSSSALVAELKRRGLAKELATRAGFDSVAAMAQWAATDDQAHSEGY